MNVPHVVTETLIPGRSAVGMMSLSPAQSDELLRRLKAANSHSGILRLSLSIILERPPIVGGEIQDILRSASLGDVAEAYDEFLTRGLLK